MRVKTAVNMAAILVFIAGISVEAAKYVAVVETEVDAASGAAANINPAEIREITAELRRQATKNLPQGRYSVMTSETVQSMGGAVLEECADENCVISLGAKIGADYIVRGTISKFQTMLTLAVELYETENGTLVVSSEAVRSESLVELLNKAKAACADMYKEFAGTQGATAQTPPMQQQYTQGTNYQAQAPMYPAGTNQSGDFTVGQRFGTFALNVIGGLGSFTIMGDKLGGSIILGSEIAIGLGLVGDLVFSGMLSGPSEYKYVNGERVSVDDGVGLNEVLDGVSLGLFYVGFFGGNIFNIVRSATYHKRKPKSSANASNFKPYDGLKFAIVPKESGDYKVLARYDYSF